MLFSVAKTDLDINQVTEFVENRLLIKRNGNTGKLYYDYEIQSDGIKKRIEICSSRIYFTNNFNSEINLTDLEYENKNITNIDDIVLHSFIIDINHKKIGVITGFESNTTGQGYIIKVLTILDANQLLVWNDVGRNA